MLLDLRKDPSALLVVHLWHSHIMFCEQLKEWFKRGWAVTESSLSSWCRNWARSSGVVPSMPCSWRYWIPLFGFLLNLIDRCRASCCVTVSLEFSLHYWVCVEDVQVNALLNDLFLLFEDLKLLRVVSAWHLGAVTADAGRGRGVQRVNASIAVYGLWGLVLSVLLFWRFLLAWGTTTKKDVQ